MRRSIVAIALLTVAAPITSVATVATTSASATTPPAVGTIFVANDETPYSIFGFAPGSTGDPAPTIDISGALTDLDGPTTVVTAPDGSLWVGGFGDSLLHFAAGANGNVAPEQDITGTETGLAFPIGLALASDGSVWVANGATNSLEHFTADENGNDAPDQTISGTNTQLADPEGVALTPDGADVWVDSNGILAEWPTSDFGNVAPIRTISGADTGIGEDEDGFAVGLDGSLWVANYDYGSTTALLHFAAGAQGNATPTQIIAGAGAFGLALDANGNVWVAQPTPKTVAELPANATASSTPLASITGTTSELTSPWGVAIYGYRPSAPQHLKATPGNKKIVLTWTAPSATGGGIQGYVVQRQAKPGVWSTVATTTKTSDTVTAKNGAATHLRVLGFNEFGYGATATSGTTARTKPGVPRKLKAKSGNGSVTLSWTKPTTTGGAPIKKYVVTMSPCPTTAKAHCKHYQVDVSGSKHKVVVKHLLDRSYHFAVQAKNAAGLGRATKKVKAVG